VTNIERIQKMNAGQLSDFLQNECMCSHCNHSIKTVDETDEFETYIWECGIDGLDCINGCFDWLKSASIDSFIEL
jgi:hypothetical protein